MFTRKGKETRFEIKFNAEMQCCLDICKNARINQANIALLLHYSMDSENTRSSNH
jgi:hypothetical protein